MFLERSAYASQSASLATITFLQNSFFIDIIKNLKKNNYINLVTYSLVANFSDIL